MQLDFNFVRDQFGQSLIRSTTSSRGTSGTRGCSRERYETSTAAGLAKD